MPIRTLPGWAGSFVDMGPYYIRGTIIYAGACKARNPASARITQAERVITSKPKYGTNSRVQYPRRVCGRVWTLHKRTSGSIGL